ncbi:MAG: peptidoglycan binding protein CsiV [Gammaproteobacteria bacterium]|nr:peptidoglycan binding protein CsiV [Gammaproteobacteria bacterium]
MNGMTWLVASLLLMATAVAQEEIIEEAPGARRYTVEIIVFRYAEDVAVGTEVFPADKAVINKDKPIYDGADNVFGDTDVAPPTLPTPAPRRNADTALPLLERVMLLKQEFTMNDVVRRLELLDAYEPIMHVGWTQPTVPRDFTRPIDLAFFGSPPQGLEGSFMLYLGRYLHLVVDLALDAPDQNSGLRTQVDEPVFNYGDTRLQNENDLMSRSGRVRYQIQEDRIFKNGDIRYFDHPKFGVIAKITRAEDAEIDAAESAPRT